MSVQRIALGIARYQYECQIGRSTYEIKDLLERGILGVSWIGASIESWVAHEGVSIEVGNAQ